MTIYETEMDGFSLVESKEELYKEEYVLVSSRGENSVHRVSNVTDNHVSFKPVKFITSTDYETANIFVVNGFECSFESRPSINQMILINKALYRVLSIDRDTKVITFEEIKLKQVRALYPVYDRSLHSGRDVHWHQAEEIFTEWAEAFGYHMQELGKGRRVSF